MATGKTTQLTVREYAQATGMTVSNLHAKNKKQIIIFDAVELPGGKKLWVIDINKYPIEDHGRVRAVGGGRKKDQNINFI